ncbi:homeobox protein cut-like 2 [Arapaima gigas]
MLSTCGAPIPQAPPDQQGGQVPPPTGLVVALNKRSKEAESAFLGVYKQLIEAPGKSAGRVQVPAMSYHGT